MKKLLFAAAPIIVILATVLLLSANSDTDAGITAPAAGLYLLRVLYAEPVFCGRDRSAKGVPGAFQY